MLNQVLCFYSSKVDPNKAAERKKKKSFYAKMKKVSERSLRILFWFLIFNWQFGFGGKNSFPIFAQKFIMGFCENSLLKFEQMFAKIILLKRNFFAKTNIFEKISLKKKIFAKTDVQKNFLKEKVFAKVL